MLDTLSLLGAAVVVFVSTNIDNMFLLIALFADAQLQPRMVVTGQLVGMSVIVLGSAVAAIAALAVPDGYIAFLGAVPLALGVRRLWALRAERSRALSEQAESAVTGILEAEYGLEQRTHSQLLAVACMTVANGADNVGVYVPLFARSVGSIPTYVLVFAILTVASCLGGYRFAKSRIVGHTLQGIGHVVLPFVLIALGLWTLRHMLVFL